MSLFSRDERYKWRLARRYIDHAQADGWFFDEDDRKIGRGLALLPPPPRLVAAHAAAVSAVGAAAAEEARREPDVAAMLDRAIDALEVLDALRAETIGAGGDTEANYARALGVLLERAEAEWTAAVERKGKAGAEALRKLRRARPPTPREEEHELIVAAFADVVEGLGATRRAVLARERAEAHRRWAAVEPRWRELHAALERIYAP